MRRLGFAVREVMEGSLQRPGENFDRPFRFDLLVVFPTLLAGITDAPGRAEGTVRIDGLARDVPAAGTLVLSPLRKRRVRYTFDFDADDGRRYRFDGWKTIRGWRVRRSWTVLPGNVYDDGGQVWATATLYFSFRRHFPGLMGSFRLRWVRPAERPAPVVIRRAA